jgi:tetratricopeptide (TPR) repeat protein
MRLLAIVLALSAPSWCADLLDAARNRQDRAELEKLAGQATAAAASAPRDAELSYQAALANSYVAEAAEQLRDRGAVKRFAEAGIAQAERAISLQPKTAEYHRILGTLYGQIAPVNLLAGLTYGKKAQSAIGKALELDPKSWRAYLSRGVGNYYVPSGLGGGIDIAIRDFQKTIELNPKSDEAYLWLGLALRKSNQNAEARKAFTKSLELNPARVWTKQQLDKTPAN